MKLVFIKVNRQCHIVIFAFRLKFDDVDFFVTIVLTHLAKWNLDQMKLRRFSEIPLISIYLDLVLVLIRSSHNRIYLNLVQITSICYLPVKSLSWLNRLSLSTCFNKYVLNFLSTFCIDFFNFSFLMTSSTSLS